MQHLTLADVSRLHNPARTPRTDQVANKTNGPVAIVGLLNDEQLTVSLRSLDSGSTLLERQCTRFNDQEFRIIGGTPGYAHGFCDVVAGETNEGLKLVIESHRCYEADPQGNASVRKVQMNIHHLADH
ncbi:hypothetical protein BJ322DRAFT_1021211 [Thelephora terrestris]|uniref:Uncharacterized protein n=1 Tax=Thelephora terrestris TaxID=56493 RepID=A0A9P6HCM1_9AGAM|nr:hypothetical protein BJ322DRAFT_1021211 [Thelephora terrestris]